MDVYTLYRDRLALENDPRNLFALRWDLHALQFEYATWVIVPKENQMVVHFIKTSRESAALYHNQAFDIKNLSLDFVFARFAWAIIRLAKDTIPTHNKKRFLSMAQAVHPMANTAIEEPPVNDGEDIHMVSEEATRPALRRGRMRNRQPLPNMSMEDPAVPDTRNDIQMVGGEDTLPALSKGKMPNRQPLPDISTEDSAVRGTRKDMHVDGGEEDPTVRDARELAADYNKAARTLPFFRKFDTRRFARSLNVFPWKLNQTDKPTADTMKN
jgi:hypothetical protein